MRRIVLFAAIAVASAGIGVALAAASPSAPSSGRFEVLTATVTSMRTADGNTFLTIERTATLTGTYTGTATDVNELVVHKDGSANLHGVGVCACTVDGRSGTFEYRYQVTGTFPTAASGQYVAGHGTGDLAGFHAKGPVSGTFMSVAYGGQRHFDP